MINMKLVLQTILVGMLLSFSSCKKANPVEPCTDCSEKPDTTSHNFIWKTETLGDAGSVAFDVAIVNDTNIWVVGEFYKRKARTDGGDSIFNAANWNGKSWKLILIPIKTFSGNLSPAALRTVCLIKNEIWVTGDAGGYAVLKDNLWNTNFNNIGSATTIRIWGHSPDNIYFIGSNGNITHYNGTTFTKMETGTDVSLTDIYGTPDGKEVWVCGEDENKGNSVLLRKNSVNSWEKLYEKTANDPEAKYDSFLSTLWTAGNGEFWVAGFAKGIIRHSYSNTLDEKVENFGRKNYPYRMRGSGTNNVFMVGDGAMIWHYNGSTWKYYNEIFSGNDRLYSVAVSKNKMVAVGRRYSDILGNALIMTSTKK